MSMDYDEAAQARADEAAGAEREFEDLPRDEQVTFLLRECSAKELAGMYLDALDDIAKLRGISTGGPR